MSNGQPWTRADRAQLRELVTRGHGDSEIARLMERDRTLIVKKRRELGLACGRDPADTAMIARMNMRQRRQEKRDG